MPRICLVFALSDPRAQTDLLREFELHDGVEAVADRVGDTPAIRVHTSDAMAMLWEVRATVGMFDEKAVELDGQA